MEKACRKQRICFLIALACASSVGGQNQDQPLRFWIDEYAFSAGETTILREEIQEAGSKVAVLAGEARSSFLSVKGYYAPEQWDIYWTGQRGCVQALPHAIPGHKISCVPGLHELTMKDRLVARLTQFYGEGAYDIIPRSYLLPSQYWQWRLWLADQEAAAQGEMWVLKEERHRGKGVHVMRLEEAVEKAKQQKLESNYNLAQAYIGNQMTVLGRKFYVRLWAVVTSSVPLRAYLFDGGVVVFGNTTPDDRKLETSDDLIVNLWHLGRNTEAAPWSVADFRMYLDNLSGSKSTFDRLWREMQRSLGLTFAAGVQSMRFSAASFPVAAASATFELVGIDFLVDKNMKPWLLEVNAVPSLARKVLNCDKQPGGCVEDGEAESVFDIEKEKLVHSLFRLLRATAGTGVTGNATAAAAKMPTLAEMLKRWRSNATDLAAMNRTSNTSRAALYSDLGWHTPAEKAGNVSSSGRSLSNSGRELKSVEPEPKTSADPGDARAETEPIWLGSSPERSARPDGAEAPSRLASDTLHIHHIARAQSVADASNLNKYVPDEERTIHGKPLSSAEHEQVLEQHLTETSMREIQVAVENRFLPLMMVPEAAAYSATHQTRGAIYPQPRHKAGGEPSKRSTEWLRAVLLPFRPVISAYGGLGWVLERLRASLVAILPEINCAVTMGVAGTIPGADPLILLGYQLFGWGDRRGTVEALTALPQHRLDQRLADHVSKLAKS